MVWAFFYYYIFFIFYYIFYYTYKSLVCCVQVRIQGSWTLVSRQMDSLQQKQPFISTLAQFHIHALSHGLNHKHNSNNQVQILSITELMKSSPLAQTLPVFKIAPIPLNREQPFVVVSEAIVDIIKCTH